ncbi:hypothetical protein GCM10022234_19620 [Aeromicrobium panaciterrae]
MSAAGVQPASVNDLAIGPLMLDVAADTMPSQMPSVAAEAPVERDVLM